MLMKVGKGVDGASAVGDDDFDAVAIGGAEKVDDAFDVEDIGFEAGHVPGAGGLGVCVKVKAERVDGECSDQWLVVDLVLVRQYAVEDESEWLTCRRGVLLLCEDTA